MIKIGLIVEGDGEVLAAPILIRRIGEALGHHIEVRRPFRVKRDKLAKPGEIERAIESTARLVGAGTPILVLLDADDDCIAKLNTQLTTSARATRDDRPISVVLANREFEAWFLASISSLRGRGRVRADAEWPGDPEEPRDAKGRLGQLMTSARYSPTVDQAALASLMDLELARQRSPSFAKLWRELEKVIASQ